MWCLKKGFFFFSFSKIDVVQHACARGPSAAAGEREGMESRGSARPAALARAASGRGVSAGGRMASAPRSLPESLQRQPWEQQGSVPGCHQPFADGAG